MTQSQGEVRFLTQAECNLTEVGTSLGPQKWAISIGNITDMMVHEGALPSVENVRQ